MRRPCETPFPRSHYPVFLPSPIGPGSTVPCAQFRALPYTWPSLVTLVTVPFKCGAQMLRAGWWCHWMPFISTALWLCQGYRGSTRTGPGGCRLLKSGLLLALQTAGDQPVLCNHMGLKSCQGHTMILVAGRNVVFWESAQRLDPALCWQRSRPSMVFQDGHQVQPL